MNWWKRLKAKHWDEIEHPGFSDGTFFSPPHTETPRFRAWLRKLNAEIDSKPLQALALLGAVLAALLGGIAAIIRSLS